VTDSNRSEISFYIAFISSITVGLYLSSLYSYLLFHSLIEITTIAIGFTLFILTWNARRFLANNILSILGIGYAFIALIDLLHTLAYKGMNVFPGFGANLPTQLWIAARSLQAVTLCVAPFFLERRVYNRVIFGIYAAAVSVLVAMVYSGNFPDCYIEGKGLTTFKISSEYVITALLLTSLYLLYRKRNYFNDRVFFLTLSSITCTAVSEISFTAYVSVYGFANLVGHFARLAAFYLIYRAILVTGLQAPFDLIFRDLKQGEEALRKSQDTLEEKVRERTAELLASEERYRSLIHKVQTAIVLHDGQGRILDSNPLAQELLGLSADQLLGKSLIDQEWHFLREDGSVLPVAAYPASLVLSTRQPLRGHVTGISRPDRDDVTWVLVNAEPEYGDAGEIALVIVSFVDITERKLAEEARHRLNRELRAISNCNQTMMRAEDEQTLLGDICRIVCDDAGYRMAWVGYAENDDARTIRPVAWAGAEDGYLEEARLTWADTERGRGPSGTAIRSGESDCIQDFSTDPQAAPWRESALQRGYRSSISLSIKDESSNTFGILNIYSTEPNAFTPDEVRLLEELSGNLAFGIAVLRARIERKQAEEALTHLAAIVESSDDAIIGKSLEGNILSWNRGAERLYGYREEEVKGRSISILFPQELAGEVSTFLENVKDGKPVEHYQTSRLRKDGSRIEVSVTISPICDSGGKVIGASSIARDITELRKTQFELQKLNEKLEQRIIERTADLNERSTELSESQQALINIVEDLNEKTVELEYANTRLKELDRLKSLFIASMSHELRTPLNSIIGFSSILHDEWLGSVNKEQKENLAIIRQSGRHLLNLINDVIDVSKIESGKIESMAEEFDLRDLIDDAVKLIKKELEEKGLVLRVTSTSQLMFTDRRRFMQCVLNLLSNAVKYSERGSVIVETRIVQIPGAPQDAGVAEISVTDTGIGIKEEEVQKLFQPFVRLGSHLVSTVPGTGLGLYLSSKLATEVLKGDLLVTSEYGSGSRFTLRVPVRLP
jgi:PAS domain S-box-containing protein